MVKLRVRSGESIQEAVRRFRKLCERSGLRKEMRRKAYYEKPSERRRREELKRFRKARQSRPGLNRRPAPIHDRPASRFVQPTSGYRRVFLTPARSPVRLVLPESSSACGRSG